MGFGDLSISNSTLSGNFTLGSLAQGGAIHTKFGALTITDSTLSYNYTRGNGASGGTINSAFSSVTLTNSTLMGSVASGSGSQGGAINDAFANLTATNSTIVQNLASAQGGGINVTSATVTLRNSILAQNLDNGTAPDLLFGGGTLVVSHSIVGDKTDTGLNAAPLGFPDANGNLIGTHALPIIPQLGLLANNGGPVLTMAPLPGSPAINAGSNPLATDPGPDHIPGNNDDTTLTTDERGAGFNRIAGATVDMGAFEIQSHVPATPTVNSLVSTTSVPVLTGTWDLVNAVSLKITVNGTLYTLGDTRLLSDGLGNWTLHTSVPIPDGIYNVTVNSANDIGETANITATGALLVETAPPNSPTVATQTTNQSKPVLTGTFDQSSVDKATVLQVTVAGTTFTLGSSPQLASDGSGNWTLTTTATINDGTYTVLVQTANAAGFPANRLATNALTIDTVPPVTPTVNTLVANTSIPVLTGTWDEGTPGGATVLQATVNGTTLTLGSSPQLASNGSGIWTLTTTAAIPDGTYTVSVHTADAAGNVANSTTTNQLLIETAAPVAPTINSLTTTSDQPILTGTWDQTSVDKANLLQVTVAGTTFTLGIDSQLASDGSGNWTLTTTSSIAGGQYAVSVHTANAAGFTADKSATNALTVESAPDIISAGATTFTVGSAGTFIVRTSGFPVPTLSESQTDVLPNGVKFIAADGVLSGTPAPGSGGTYTLHFTAANGIGSNVTKPLTLQVVQAPAFTSANNATFTLGFAGSFTVTASGVPAPTLAESNTDVLPNGVKFNAATGVLSGTPLAGTIGGYVLHFTADDGVSPDATQTFTLMVSSPFPFSGEYAVSSAVGSPTLASIGQSGNTLTLNGTSTATATVTSAAQILVNGTDLATYGNSSITFTSGAFAGQTWTKLDLPTAYTSSLGGAAQITQNGATGLSFFNSL